jgi:deoxyribonuclease-4
MKIGIAGIPVDYKKKGILHGIEGINVIGLDALEYQMGRGIRLTVEKAEQIGACKREHQVDISLHAPYYLNFSVQDESLQKWMGALHQTIRLAVCMDASITVVHPGWVGKDMDRKTCLKNIMSNLQEVPTVGIETMGRINAMGHFEEVLEICSQTDHRPVLDFAHIHALQHLQSKDDFLKIFEEVEAILGHQSHFHAHFTAVEVKNGEEKKHIPLDDGEPHFMHLAQAVIEQGYNTTVICESPALDQDALKMKEIYSHACSHS